MEWASLVPAKERLSCNFCTALPLVRSRQDSCRLLCLSATSEQPQLESRLLKSFCSKHKAFGSYTSRWEHTRFWTVSLLSIGLRMTTVENRAGRHFCFPWKKQFITLQLIWTFSWTDFSVAKNSLERNILYIPTHSGDFLTDQVCKFLSFKGKQKHEAEGRTAQI